MITNIAERPAGSSFEPTMAPESPLPVFATTSMPSDSGMQYLPANAMHCPDFSDLGYPALERGNRPSGADGLRG